MAVKSRFSRRRWVSVVVLILVGVLIWFFLLRTRTTVQTALLERGDIEVDVTAYGTVQPRNYVDVGAQASGAIRHITVHAGSEVRQGELLMDIDPSIQQAKVEADQASLDSLRAQLTQGQAQADLAREQYARQRRMAADGATRDEDVQTANAALQAAVAHVADVRAQIAGASSTLKGDTAQLGYTRIYSPMSGTVVTLDALEGQTLNATYQTPKIMRIADLSVMTVWTQVSEADVRKIHPGMKVYFTTLGDDRRWHGTVRQILPAPRNTDQDSSSGDTPKSEAASTNTVVLYPVLFDVSNTDRALMPQMSAQVFFVEAAAQDVLTAPLTAMTLVAGQSNLYDARVQTATGEIVSRRVKIGVHDRLHAEVLSGLSVGERLVTGITRTRPLSGRFTW